MNDFVAQLSVSVVTDVPTLYMEDEYFQAKLAKYWNATPKRPLDRPGAGTRQCPWYTRLVSGRGIGKVMYRGTEAVSSQCSVCPPPRVYLRNHTVPNSTKVPVFCMHTANHPPEQTLHRGPFSAKRWPLDINPPDICPRPRRFGMAVASAEPYANNLHLAPDR